MDLDTPHIGDGRRGIVASMRYVTLFALSLIAVGTVIGYAADDGGYGRYRPWISEKLAVLAARPPTPNVIFVGASVTLRSIVPKEVDAAAASAGCPDVHSINLGMPGARLYESSFMIDKVLETADLPVGTMVVFDALSSDVIEFNDIATSDRRPVTARLRYLPDVIAGDRWSWDYLEQVAQYARASTGEALGIHSLSDIAMQPGRKSTYSFDEARVSDQGYVSLESENKARRRERYLKKNQQSHLQSLEQWSTEPYLKDGSSVSINPFAHRIKAAGYVPVAYAAPWGQALLAAAIDSARLDDPSLLAIAMTPQTAPAVYANNDLWFDQGHMSEAGAKYVSSIVGRDLCRIRKSL